MERIIVPLIAPLVAVAYFSLVAFVVVMLYRLVRAVERISYNLEKGIVIRKENTTA